MEFLNFHYILNNVINTYHSSNVQMMVRVIGWESYVLLDGDMMITYEDWYDILKDKSVDIIPILERLNSGSGTEMSQVLLAYTVMRTLEPNNGWSLYRSGSIPFIKGSNKIFFSPLGRIRMTDMRADSCDIDQVIEILTQEYRSIDSVPLYTDLSAYGDLSINRVLSPLSDIIINTKEITTTAIIPSVQKTVLFYKVSKVYRIIMGRLK